MIKLAALAVDWHPEGERHEVHGDEHHDVLAQGEQIVSTRIAHTWYGSMFAAGRRSSK
jgi:hypothetical protein